MLSQEELSTLIELWPRISDALPDDLAVLCREMNEIEIISVLVEASGRQKTRLPVIQPEGTVSALLVAAIRNVLAERR